MTTPAPVEPDRLNGWKEIAAHLGKGTRTAQRWEKEYGLPVHRIGRERGEIVFAFRGEIDRWVRRTAGERLRENGERHEGEPGSLPASPATGGEFVLPDAAAAVAGVPARRGRFRLGLATGLGLGAVVLATLAGGLAGKLANGPPPAPAQPAGWRLVDGVVSVLDDSGRTLFSHDFGAPTGAPVSSADPVGSRGRAVEIADIDGDGRAEVLVRVPAVRREDRRFYCFEADGRLRFGDEPRGTVRFGDADYGEPWLAHRVFLTGAKDRLSLYVAFTHNLWFPARLRRLDAHGALLSEYWSNGYVEFVEEAVWKGRPVVLVGGVANDVRGGSLAIFEAAGVSGHAPSATPAHACHGCPPGGPRERLTFPTMCIFRGQGALATVVDAWVEAGDRLTVEVLQSRGNLGSRGASAEIMVHYTLGPDLSLLRAEISREFQAEHQALEKQAVLDHRLGRRDEEDMFPVLRFGPDGAHPLTPVAVTR